MDQSRGGVHVKVCIRHRGKAPITPLKRRGDPLQPQMNLEGSLEASPHLPHNGL